MRLDHHTGKLRSGRLRWILRPRLQRTERYPERPSPHETEGPPRPPSPRFGRKVIGGIRPPHSGRSTDQRNRTSPSNLRRKHRGSSQKYPRRSPPNASLITDNPRSLQATRSDHGPRIDGHEITTIPPMAGGGPNPFSMANESHGNRQCAENVHPPPLDARP